MGAVDDLLNKYGSSAPRTAVAGPRGMAPAAVKQQQSSVDNLLNAHGGSFGSQQATDMTGSYRSWYSGQNLEGTKGGWDTDFQKVFQDRSDEAYRQGKIFDYFAQDDATGVVTWDNANSAEPGKKWKFGDVLADGKWVGNVYEDYDRHTANVMMGEYVVQTGARKAELNTPLLGDANKAWDEEINKIRAENTRLAETEPRRMQFNANVREELREDEDKDRFGVVLGGAAGTAAMAASAGGMIAGPVGAVVGGIGGGVVGGVAAWLNSDSLIYQLERSQEQFRIASREGATIQSGLDLVSQNVMTIGMSPLQNLIRGSYDATRDGGVTGGTLGGEFMETNAAGQRKAPMWIQGTDIVGLIGDSALQLLSPVGKAMYQAQMGGQIGAGVIGFLPGQGHWDPEQLKQDSIWTSQSYNPDTQRYEENVDVGNVLAGIGNVGIDVVQLSAFSSMSRQVDRLANQTARATGQAPSQLTRSFGGGTRPWERLNMSKEQRAALKAGGDLEVKSGYKFVLDAEGKVVGKGRMTASMLAPSEGLTALSAKMLARRDAARRGGAMEAEDLYTTAAQLAHGQRNVTALLVNAVGEGQEEFVQGLLEPWSQDRTVHVEDLMRATISGAAGGFGMTYGARAGMPSQDVRMYSAAMVGHMARTGGEPLSYETWQGMSELQKRTLVKAAEGMAKTLTDGAYDKISADRIRGTVGGVVGAQRWEDYQRDMLEAAAKTGAEATDQANTIVMHESYTFRPEVMATSHGQLLQNQQDRTAGAVTQLDELGKDIAELKAAIPDPAAQAADPRLVGLQAEHAALKKVIDASQVLERTIGRYFHQITAELAGPDPDRAESIIDELNGMLEDMFDLTANTYDLVMKDGTVQTVTLSDEMMMPYAKAASRLLTRDPADSTGSWQMLLPQVDKVWAAKGVDGLYGINQIVLQAVRGDFDGDKMRTLQQLIVDDQRYKDMRSGANILGVGAMPEIGSSKHEKFLTMRVMQSWDAKNVPLREAARKVAREIERDLMERYHNVPQSKTPIPKQVVRDVSAAAQEALMTGQDVRKTVLTMMSERAGNDLTKIGRGEYWRPGQAWLSNESYWMAHMITGHMTTFQEAYAAHSTSLGEFDPNFQAVAPDKTSTTAKSTTPLRGPTESTTAIMELPGSNMFRMFQKLHYTLFESTEKYVGWGRDAGNEQYIKLVEFYEELSQGVSQQRNDRLSPSDQIIGQVNRWLEAMAADPVERDRLGITEAGNMALIANVGMPQMIWARDAKGERHMKYTGHNITIGQHLLYLSLEKFRSENSRTWDKDLDQKSAYNNLFDLTKPSVQGSNPGNAEMAFVEIFNSTRLYDMVGADSVSLGVNRTVGQVYRELVSMSVEERDDNKYAIKGSGAYREAAKGFTIPFGEEAIKAGSVTGYKSVVDSLFSAADSSLSMNRTGNDPGKVHGRFAEQDKKRGKKFREMWAAVQVVLNQLDPNGGKRTADDIARIINERPDFGHKLMAVLPKEVIPFAMKKVDERGIPIFSTWFYEVWTADTAKQAEMSFNRNYILDSWYAKKLTLDIDFARGDKDEEKKIAFHSLTSRMHRVIFRLASSAVRNDDGDSIPLQAFLSKFNEMDDVAEFYKWLNLEEGMNLEGPPLLAWMDEVSIFDVDKSNGGWSSGSLSTPLLMEHISNLKKTSERLVGDLGREKTRSKADVATGQAVARWLLHLKNPNNPRILADPKDEVQYIRFAKLIEAASRSRMTNGPRAMLEHTAHLVYGMYAPAAAKGQHPDQMAANAALEAMDNAFGYLTTPERVLGDLTAHNEDAVAQAPQMILRDGGTTMNRYGQQVDWSMDAVEAMLPLVLKPESHPLMRSVLFDTVIELDSDNVARRKFLMGSTLDSVMSHSTVRDLFPDEGNPNLQQSLKFLTKLEANLRDTQKHALEQMVTELVINRVMGLGTPASFEEIQSMTTKAYMDYAALIEVASQTDENLGGEDPAHVAHDQMKQAMQAISLSETFGIPIDAFTTTTKGLKDLVKKDMLDPIEQRIERMTDEMGGKLKNKQRDLLQAEIEREQRVLTAMKAKVERMFDLNVTQSIVAALHYDVNADPASRFQRETELMEYVYDHQELMRTAGEAMTSVVEIMRHYDENPRDQKMVPFKLTPEAWETLSNVIITKEIQDLLTVTPADHTAPPYPKSLEPGSTGIDKQKYWDHTRSYLFGFLSPTDTTGILAVARKMASDAGMTPPRYGREDIVRKVRDTVLRLDELGPWDPAVPIMAAESLELLQGASAIPSISMYGLLQQRWGAAMQATRRQTADTVADAVVTITGDDLNWMENGPFTEVTVTAGNGRDYLRPMAQLNNRFAEELSLTYTAPDGTPSQPIDLFNHKNVAWTWYPAKGSAPATRLKQVNLTRLNEEVSRLLKNNHPGLDDVDFRALLDSARVSMRFVNPDAQPITADHANSLWHEGTVYLSDGDVGDSLIKAFFYGIGATNATGQQAALDTRKLALMGIEDYQRPTRQEVLDMEARAGLDFGGMLAEKTKHLMDTKVSGGKPMDINLFNAAYKIMKLKHWLEGTDPATGARVRWSAEQATEWQMTNPGVDLFGQDGPLKNAVLWKPSDQVLADMLGEIGFGGVKGRSLKQRTTMDLTSIEPYESVWSEEMERKFPVAESQPTDILSTDAARQAYVQDLKVSSFVTPEERTKFQRKQDAFVRMRSKAQDQRTKDVNRRGKTFDPARNGRDNIDLVTKWVVDLDVELNLPRGQRFLAKEYQDLLESTLSALSSYTEEHRGRVGKQDTSFWIFQEDGQSDAEAGRLTKSNMSGGLTIVPGEVVFIDTAQYRDMDPDAARTMAMDRIGSFVNQGAAIMIGSSRGNSALISELQRLTRAKHGYQRYENNSNILVPDVLDESDTQNVAAARSRLTAPTRLEILKQRVSLLFSDKHVEENTMWVEVRAGKRSKFDTIQVQFDLLPIDAHTKFMSANTRDTAQAIYDRLLGLGDRATSAGVDLLRQEALRHLYVIDKATGKATAELAPGVTDEQVVKESEEFDTAWDNMMRAMDGRVEAYTSEPQPGEKFGTGDFIPLINSHTNELMLYRHGYKYPDVESFQRQLVTQVAGHTGERGIAMYSGEREPSATTHRGTVAGVVPSPGRGFRLELEVEVRDLGQKISVEHNGMKYVITYLPHNVVLPQQPLFGDVDIDGLASLHDVLAKEATGGLVTNFQNAFAFFGIDFMPDLQKFFGLTTTGEVYTLLRRIAALPNKMSVQDVYRRQSLMAGQDAYVSAITRLLPQLLADNFKAPWIRNLSDATPEAFVARAMMMYLMSPGADVDVVVQSTGFSVTDRFMPRAASQRMPELFTRAFDLSAPDSDIRQNLEDRINAKLNKSGDEYWHFSTKTWELEGRVAGASKIRGKLQYGEAHVTDDNIDANLMAHERKVSQTASMHQALMNMIGTGATLRPGQARKKIARLDAMRRQDLTVEEEAGAMWRDLTFVDPATNGPGARWQQRTAAEHRFDNWSRSRMVLYRQPIDLKSKAFTRDPKLLQDIEEGIQTIRRRTGLRKSDEERVHYWIRQMLYHPAESNDQDAFEGDLAPNDVLGAVAAIMENLDDGYLPTYDSAGPSFFHYQDLYTLFQASQRNPNSFRPYSKERDPKTKASVDDLGQWISIAFAQAINEKVAFDPIYRLDFSGLMNTYQTVLRNSGQFMDITFDKEYQGKLLDPKSNELVTVSFDPVEDRRLRDQVIMQTAHLEYDDLMSGASTGDSVAWRQRRLAARARWRKRRSVHPVKVKSPRDFHRNGIELINRDADMHSVQRMVIAMRHGTAMLNTGLYFSMIPEQGFRMYLSEMTNLLTGDSTLRSASKLQRGLDNVTGGRFEFAQYTPEQIDRLNKLFTQMGNDGAFTATIMKDLMFTKNPTAPNKAVAFFEKFAAIGNWWQDPTRGTTQKALARHYFEAVMRSIEAAPTRNVMTVDQVIDALSTDPAHFAKHEEWLHEMASNAVVDFRSLKNTPYSLAIKSIYDPWSQSPNALKRFAGTLLKMQGMYATYNMNVLTSITGMQGYTDMLAAFIDGRKTPKSFISMWFNSRDGKTPTDDDYATMDMSSVIDGVTIANSFIKGGVTQTGLFMLGMMAGGVLSGEDDEMKRRRMLAEAQHAPLIMDPRRLEADFRNKDALFLDWMPPQLQAFFRVQGDDGHQGSRAMVQMSWILKPFLSPILGMERFFMTGDFSYVTHGFMDAIGSMPLVNKDKWDDVVRAGHELQVLAADQQEIGSPTATRNVAYLLGNIVGMYENMLVENMFVNSLYAGFDMYDRDPTKLVLRDSDGDIQRTIENDARKNDVALSDYVGEDGIQQAYKERDPLSARLAAYTEGHLTAAAMLSLFKPIHHQEFFRGDMPVMERTIKRPGLSNDEARVAVVLATLQGQQAAGTLERRLSLDEVTAMLKDNYLQTKNWDAYNNLDANAAAFYNSEQNPKVDPLTFLGPQGKEMLTKSGQVALIKGLQGGTITLDDPEIRAMSITVEQRQELARDFYNDMTRQGIDLGLTHQQATKRATRLMLGPLDDGTVKGFKDILDDKRIPTSPDLKYKQLNTTYVTGPDGFPWATGFKRGGAPGLGGFWSLLGGVKKPTIGMANDAITQDGRMNSVDQVNGVDTGMRGVVPFNKTENIPTDRELNKALIDALNAQPSAMSSYVPNSNETGGSGFGGYGGSFYRRGGGGGGGRGYSPTIYWSRQPTLPRGTNVFGNSAKNLFWNNANIRRTTIRRERYQASRGRLNQWQ